MNYHCDTGSIIEALCNNLTLCARSKNKPDGRTSGIGWTPPPPMSEHVRFGQTPPPPSRPDVFFERPLRVLKLILRLFRLKIPLIKI